LGGSLYGLLQKSVKTRPPKKEKGVIFVTRTFFAKEGMGHSGPGTTTFKGSVDSVRNLGLRRPEKRFVGARPHPEFHGLTRGLPKFKITEREHLPKKGAGKGGLKR